MTVDNLRILIDSNAPFEPTGYGRQTKYMCQMFKELGHEVGVVAMHGLHGSSIMWQDVPIFPQRVGRYCLEEMRDYVAYFDADVVITLYDLWHFPPNAAEYIGAPWIAMVPVEGAPVRGRLPRLLRSAAYVVTYSEFGERALLDAKIPSTMIPHVVDTNLYKPGDKETVRDYLGMPQDKYIVTMVAMNKGSQPYRKAWPEMIRAWAGFQIHYGDVLFYAHTNRRPIAQTHDSGFVFDDLIDDLGIPWSSVAFPDKSNFTVGIPDEEMVKIYQASDVVILPSMAEGFGLPVIESQAAGRPIIAHACSAMSELIYNGLEIPQGELHWMPERAYWWYRPRVEDIVGTMINQREAWSDEDYRARMSHSGREEMCERYSLEAVTPMWDKFLTRVGGELW
jgi:glycosyltransferase involved in cell wall biosynthesis